MLICKTRLDSSISNYIFKNFWNSLCWGSKQIKLPVKCYVCCSMNNTWHLTCTYENYSFARILKLSLTDFLLTVSHNDPFFQADESIIKMLVILSRQSVILTCVREISSIIIQKCLILRVLFYKLEISESILLVLVIAHRKNYLSPQILIYFQSGLMLTS